MLILCHKIFNKHSLFGLIIGLMCSSLASAQSKADVISAALYDRIQSMTVPAEVWVDYEFCSPNTQKARRELAVINMDLSWMCGSSGRIGCKSPKYCLVIGHQKNQDLRILRALAKKPYIHRIEPTFWE